MILVRQRQLIVQDNSQGNWNHWVVTKNVLSGESRIYFNGVLWLLDSDSFRPIKGVNWFIIGFDGPTENAYSGLLDEFKISKVDRNEHWIKLSYENQRIGSSVLDFE